MIDPFTHPGAAPRIFQETAWCLAGKMVAVYFSNIGLEGDELGQYDWEDEDNCWIKIFPGLAEEQTYRVFLHECAHAALDWVHVGKHDRSGSDRVARVLSGEDQDPEAIQLKPSYEAIRKTIEDAAFELGFKWEDAAILALGPDSTYMARLEWLRNTSYKNPKFLENPPSKAEEGTQNE